MPTREDTLRRVRHAVDPERDTRIGPLVHAARRYVEDGMMERAPGLAYYGVLSLFPAVIVGFAVVRLIGGDSAPQEIAAYAHDHGASGAVSGAVRSAIQTSQGSSTSTAASAGALSLLTLVYGASRSFTAVGRGIDAVGRRRPLPRSPMRRLKDIGWTLALLALGLVVVLMATVSSKVLDEFLGLFGVGGAASTIWAVLRFPVAAALAFLIIAIVRWAAPTGGETHFRMISPGRVTTLASLVVATAGFKVYVTYLASYNANYGAFAGMIIFMLWIWMAGSTFLYGAELDAVLRERAEARAAAASPETADDAPVAPVHAEQH